MPFFIFGVVEGVKSPGRYLVDSAGIGALSGAVGDFRCWGTVHLPETSEGSQDEYKAEEKGITLVYPLILK
jgi:hypothetical protein